MPSKPYLLMLGALFCISASVPASAQTVYKCGARRTTLYTEKPCSRRIVNTDEAPVPVTPKSRQADIRRAEQNRAAARALRPRPDESAAQFETRRRRASMRNEDREECERIETRMPVEKAGMKNPDDEEVSRAELENSRKRFKKLRC